MGRGFEVNEAGIRAMMEAIQQQMDKHPVRARVEADTSGVALGGNVFNGPVIHGDVSGSQLAWGNSTVQQTQNPAQQEIAPGFEAVAQAVIDALRELPTMGAPQEDLDEAAAAGAEVLNEVVQAEPDRGKIRRAVAALKGYLAPIATTAITAGAVAGADESAKALIERLSTAL